MPATSPAALARKNARRYERLKAQRQAAPGWKARPRLPVQGSVPFVGCDGEGTSNKGEHSYALFRIGDRELYRGGRRLETGELLTFILASPPRSQAILIGFAFGYDISCILRDVPMLPETPGTLSRMERLLERPGWNDGGNKFRNPWTWLTLDGYPEFGVMWLPRKYLKVCYAQTYEIRRRGVVEIRRRSIPRTIRTIEDAFGFFQKSFLGALGDWGMGSPALIERMKAKRSSFRKITPAIRRYNKLECDLLGSMMQAFREATLAADIRLTRWDGAGAIADFMLKTNGAMRRVKLEGRHQNGLTVQANAAYYGGRFEVTRVGRIDEPVTEADINSAYPAALQDAIIPCHRHGRWRKVSAAVLQKELRRPTSLFVAPVCFHHPQNTFLCGLPFRQHSGTLCWPRDGRGVYWSPELRSARRLGCQVTVEAPGWLYERRCDCEPYGWLKRTYEARKALGKAQRGIPLKLGCNSVYGKLAQRVGGAPWGNVIDAGLCTALTRAKLNYAIAAAGPANVIMLATDGLYCVGKVPQLDRGGGLGQWEIKRHPGMFIVQPGLYWPLKKRGKWAPQRRVKSRGVAASDLENVIPKFHRAWANFQRVAINRRRLAVDYEDAIPIVPVRETIFVGLRLAMHRKAYDDACKWLSRDRMISFDWRQKRGHDEPDGRSVILAPKAGDRDAASMMYEPRTPLETEISAKHELRNLEFEAMPDPIDRIPPVE